MVGIYRKAKQLIKFIQQYSPFLDNIVPGASSVVGGLAGLADDITDGINNVYEDYGTFKKSDSGKYGLSRGLKTFFSRPTAANTLTKEYGGLHPRLKLKSGGDSE
jgi:hypothetical protein